MEIVYLTLASTILGWLLGMLSPAIVKKITEKSEKKNLIKIIFSDLEELKKRLAPLPLRVYPKYGRLDKEILEWLKVNLEIYFSKGLEDFAQKGLTTEQILGKFNADGEKDGTNTYFKKCTCSR